MTDEFAYRPKFVDIRVKKSSAKEKVVREPPPTPCDHIGCQRAGLHKAPKGRDRSNEYWHFCVDHAADYNRRWNYFSGMSDDELADFQRKEETGHRPTWTLRGGKGDRLSASMRNHQAGKRVDPYDMFGPDAANAAANRPEPARRLSRLQRMSLEALSLGEAASAAEIRARYAEQVKRWHPDSNGGDRGAETRLQKVVQAYQTLKAGGLV